MIASAPDLGARARVRAAVAHAARIVAPAWPLETFIAVNPLGGLEHLPFEEALTEAGAALGARGTLSEAAFRALHAGGRVSDDDLRAALRRRLPGLAPAEEDARLAELLRGEPAPDPVRTLLTLSERHAPEVAALVDAQTVRWCAAYFDGGEARWPMPGRDRGLFGSWRGLATRDRSLPRAARDVIAILPEGPDEALLEALGMLGGGAAAWPLHLRAHLAALPGWAAHVRWRAEHEGSAELVDYLALRLCCEAALLAGRDVPRDVAVTTPPAPADPGERLPAAARLLVWLDAYEEHWRAPLLAALDRPAPGAAPERPAAQLVCCIDARSEGLRRHLEALGPYDTLGFAGFFAVAIRYQDLAGGAPSALCPVLLAPRNAVREEAAPGAESAAERHLAGRRALTAAEAGFHAAKANLAAPFALAEASGWAAGPLAAAKTLLAGPYSALRERAGRAAAPDAPTVVGVEEAFTLEERALFAEVALTMMGLTSGFGRLVVLCGHGSRTENNPYAAALDCGACGGNAGGPNARTAAAILNGDDVRRHLAERGIEVPADTWFAAAEHDTASDRVTLLDEHLIPPSHRAEHAALAADLREAGARLSAERAADLPGAPAAPAPRRAARHVRARGADWAQVFPEWGLAGNAAFIVGPRAMTRGLDLERRCFLHSYEASVDADGTALETILTAPLVVAQWINCQYYFSTVDPVVFGAGSKTIHNVVGGFGVLAGQDGDLQTGLPWQSVTDGTRLVHEPMRLLAIVQAPPARIDAIVERNTILQHLFGNGWVALAARERPGDRWRRRATDGHWTEETTR